MPSLSLPLVRRQGTANAGHSALAENWSEMSSFIEHCDEHAGLETVDPIVFLAGDGVSDGACELVLTLAAIFNDAKDIGYGITCIQEAPPPGRPCRSRAWGQYSGLELHLYRQLFGLLHELLVLLHNNEAVLQEPVMKSTLRKMSPKGRLSWDRLVGASHGKKPSDPLAKSIMLARHQVAFHYDAGQIARGYKAHFTGDKKEDDRAYLSRGTCMRASRFYFADAAVQGFLRNVATSGEWDELVEKSHEIFENLNQALMDFIATFILERGGSFRASTDEMA